MASSRSLRTDSSLGEQLGLLAASGQVRPAGPEEAVAGVPARWVVAAGSEQEVAAVLRFADETRLSVLPRGGGTKFGWGNAPQRADVILSLARLNRVVEHAWEDLTVTVEAGCAFAELQRVLAGRGQRLAVDPLWPERATVGGILSANDTGVLRLGYGGLRDLVLGVTLALADGTLAKSGGKVVKNVAGYDLPKLATGALGTLGVITRAIFRLHPLPADTRVLSFQVRSMDEAQQAILQLLDAKLSLAALQARAGSDAAAAIDIGLEGTAAGLSAQERLIRELVRPRLLHPETAEVWAARQDLWNSPGTGTVAKCSVTPSSIGKTLASVLRLAAARNVPWRAAVQATGIGWLGLDAGEQDSLAMLEELRAEIEGEDGSLVFLHAPAAKMEAWGKAGDALPLMRALKRQFDPKGTLNPGRYVGGI